MNYQPLGDSVVLAVATDRWFGRPSQREMGAWREPDSPPRDGRFSRVRFTILSAYIASQAYTVPVLPIGPNWAVWPTIPDLLGIVLVVTIVASGRRMLPTPHQRRVLGLTLGILAGSALWYVVPLLFVPGGVPQQQKDIGLYELAREVQFIVVAFAVTTIDLTPPRLQTLARVVGTTIVAAGVLTIATSVGVLETRTLAPQLPVSSIAGPWISYAVGNIPGQGGMGYEHGYTAVQFLILLGLWMNLKIRSQNSYGLTVPALTMAAVFFTQSRAGLAVAALFVGLAVVMNPRRWASVAMIAALIVLAVLLLGHTHVVDVSAQRASTLVQLGDPRFDTLSGRTELWSDKIAFLMADPIRWIVGAGLGSSYVDTVAGFQADAHMFLLQVTTETGLIGVTAFLIWFFAVLTQLARVEVGWRPYFWCTLALFVSGFAQETFYPVAAFQGLIGLYLVGLMIAVGQVAPAHFHDARNSDQQLH